MGYGVRVLVGTIYYIVTTHDHNLLIKIINFEWVLQDMVVEHTTQHLLQGKTLLQVEVSMPPHILIR